MRASMHASMFAHLSARTHARTDAHRHERLVHTKMQRAPESLPPPRKIPSGSLQRSWKEILTRRSLEIPPQVPRNSRKPTASPQGAKRPRKSRGAPASRTAPRRSLEVAHKNVREVRIVDSEKLEILTFQMLPPQAGERQPVFPNPFLASALQIAQSYSRRCSEGSADLLHIQSCLGKPETVQ